MDTELTQHAVIRSLTLPHCPERQHEAFDERDHSLGMRPCEHPDTIYAPGHTVFLTADQAAELVASGDVAPVGAENVEELIVRAAAERHGLVGDLTMQVTRKTGG
jgi:hypothetical protein